MNKIAQRLKFLKLDVPTLSKPLGAYVSAVRAGGFIYTSGQLPMVDGRIMFPGRVGKEVSEENARRAARQATLNALGAVQSLVRDLDKIKKIVRLNGFVCCALGYYDQPKVLNAASDLLVEVFGEEIGQHSRVAVGCLELPLQSCVEIDLIVEL